jgi:hypothetical protein
MLEICKMHIGFSSVLQRFSASSTGANSDVSDAIAEAKGVQPKRGMILPFQPLTIAFHHINYFIDMPAVSHSLSLFLFNKTQKQNCSFPLKLRVIFSSIFRNLSPNFLGKLCACRR